MHLSRKRQFLLAAIPMLLLIGSRISSPLDLASNQGFLQGVLHPLSGLDHVLAMISVGAWGALLGAPLTWALPVVFPLFMVAGGLLALGGSALPHAELGIVVSVVTLGSAIAAGWRPHAAVAFALIALFAIFHGHAHGAELPAAAAPAAYAGGFVLSTAWLHLGGVFLGMAMKRRDRSRSYLATPLDTVDPGNSCPAG